MARICMLTGKRHNTANHVSHSHIKTKRRQLANIQTKRIWYDKEQRFVKLRISTSAMRTLTKKSLEEFATEAGLDLSKH